MASFDKPVPMFNATAVMNPKVSEKANGISAPSLSSVSVICSNIFSEENSLSWKNIVR
ncbi:MAG: hypothetical protein S4CHLAM27_02700 [Chlamydiia bacterium]|nr:hypothetical protein [Chlamydiia bacterium]